MFLNVIKGTYPGLEQVDLTLPVAVGQTGIERGSLLKVNADREWEVATSSDVGSATVAGAVPYIALMSQDDLTAGMAGDVGTGAVSAAEGQPVVNALGVQPSQQIETDMFDDAVTTWGIGDWCSIGDGGVFTEHTDGETAVAKVDALPVARWVNNAWAVTGQRTGNAVRYITLTTLYVPHLSVS